MYINYFNNANDICLFLTIFIAGLIIDFIANLVDFKIFAKKYYYKDINLFEFSICLIYSKIKRHNI